MHQTTSATDRVVAVLGDPDLAEPSDAVRWAAGHASARRLPLHLIHTARVPALVAVGAGTAAERSDEADLWRPFARIVGALQSDNPGLEVTAQAAPTGPTDMLLRELRRTDLLVVAEPGGSGTGGGLADPVRMPCAVAVVPAGTPAILTNEIVLGVDAAFSRSAADFAFTAAADLHVPVRAVYTTGAVVSYGAGGLPGREAKGDRDRAGFDRCLRTAGGGYPGVLAVTPGRFAAALGRAGRGPRIVVVSARAVDGLDIGLGHIRAVHPGWRDLLADASCPVVLVPAG